MSVNRIDPSSINPNVLDTRADRSKERPLGISILAVLQVVGGVALGALWVWISTLEDTEQWLFDNGLSVPVFVAFGAVCTVLAIAGGVGMWLGDKWAWWLSSFYYFSMLVGRICQLLLILPLKARSLDMDEIGLEAARHGGRGVILFQFVAYLFRSRVLEYFDLGSMRKLKAMAILFGMSLLFIVGMTLLIAAHVISRRG